MLADKKHLQAWIDAGRKRMREDSVGIDAMLKSYSETLIRDNTIKNSSIYMGAKNVEGFSFNIYQPFYKASPLGMVLDMEIRVDGRLIPRRDIYLILEKGQRIRLLEARTIQDIWWNIVDPISVFIPHKGGLPAGDHELEFTIAEMVAAYYEHPKDLIMGTVKTTMRVS